MGLVVVAILKLVVLVIVVVMVIIDLVKGNLAHRFIGLFTFGGANLLMSSLLILDIPFFVNCPWIF